MLRAPVLFSVFGISFFGCGSKEISFRNTPPNVEITDPVEGELFDIGENVHFEALVADSQDDSTELSILWESSIDGLLDDEPADAAGLVLFDTSILSSGLHTVSLQVTDVNEESATTSVSIQVGGVGPGATAAPMIYIEGPMDGDEYLQTEMITVIAQVQDNEQDWNTIQTSIISSRDGQLWSGFPDDAGIIELDTTLTVGSHTITVRAIDDDMNQNTESVGVNITADSRPAVMITSPIDGDWFWNSDMIHFEAEVSDDITHPQDLLIEWSSDVDGIFGILPANAAGITDIDTILSAGYHLITLAVTDGDDNTTEASIPLEVRDPLAHDADLDGYSEIAGDCDDTDPYTSPDADEVCDDYDNDCDGAINEDFVDEYEPLDLAGDSDGDEIPDYIDRDSAYDAGEVDGSFSFLGLGGGSDETAVGLTLHSEEDEDWIYFNADDDWFDTPDFRVAVGTFPSGGSYAVELYSSAGIEDTATGSGRLSVGFRGDSGFLGFGGSDEDDFWIRIYSDSWLASDCDRRITVDIEAL